MKLKSLLLPVFFLITSCNEFESDIEVYISTGELQCQDNGLSLSETKAYLLELGIEVKAEWCGVLTEINHPTVCGAGTSKIHVFTIEKSHSLTAEYIGFTISDSSVTEDHYEKTQCGV